VDETVELEPLDDAAEMAAFRSVAERLGG